MNKKASTRFMKHIVSICLSVVIISSIASYVSAWRGIDTVPILTIVASAFMGELVMTVLLRLLQKDEQK